MNTCDAEEVRDEKQPEQEDEAVGTSAAEIGEAQVAEGAEQGGFVCSAEAQKMTTIHSAPAHEGHSRRERIALGIFACLIILGVVALSTYIGAGHGLNVAATSIDDITGDMAGYGVILFEGTVNPQTSSYEEEDDGLLFGSTTSSLGASTSEITLEEVRQEYREKGASVISLDSSNLQGYASGRVIVQDGRTYGIFSLTEEELANTPSYDLTTTRTISTITESATGDAVTSTTSRTRGIFSSVSELFEVVDAQDVDPAVITKVDAIVDHFEAVEVDIIIALTPSVVPFCAVEGVDVVVTFKESDRFSVSETIDGTLYMDAPEVGAVGVLMVAPGNVVSTKVMTGD